ncbi:MAG: PmbA/TldA family metallopeptidase, partial [Thermosphaera sp.]
MIDESLLYSAIKHASELGAEYVEARFQKDYGFAVSLRNGKILGAGSSRKSGVGIRVLINGSLGFSSTNIIDRENVLEAVEKAVARAKSLSSLRKNPIKFSNERVGKASYQVMVKRRLEDLVVEDVVEMGSSLYNTLTKELTKAKIPVSTFSFETHTQEKLIITS